MNKQLVRDESGFTLVELAIVLVIIGLIIGGVLVGQDLIKAAEVRSTVSQFERYNATVNAFRDKYRYLPGDIPATAALNFGFDATATARLATSGNGDGNSLIEGGAATNDMLNGETALFWVDMYNAQLLDTNLLTYLGNAGLVTCADPNACKLYMPEAKIGRGNFITVYSQTGRNFFQIVGMTDVTAGNYTVRAALSPQEAFNIDSKIDDGLALTGGVRAFSTFTTPNFVADAAAVPVAGVCVTDGSALNPTSGTYNTGEGDTITNTPACALRLRMN